MPGDHKLLLAESKGLRGCIVIGFSGLSRGSIKKWIDKKEWKERKLGKEGRVRIICSD